MRIEETVRASLTERLDALDVPPGDLGRAMREGARGRRRRPALVGVAVAASLVLVAALGFALRGAGPDRADPAPATGNWVQLPDAPLSPRAGARAVWTGREALFLGGNTGNICPPDALCTTAATVARDGAAYDPATRRWRLVAATPVPVESGVQLAMVGETLVIVGNDGTWHAYDLDTDTWRGLPEPPDAPKYVYGTSVLDGRVHILGRAGVVQVLDLATEIWSALPASPHQPRIRRHTVQATPEGIVAFGTDSTVKNDGTVPAYTMAEVFHDGTWRRAPTSELMTRSDWEWTGQRLVSPSVGCIGGGEVNAFPRCVPEGGSFDPASLTWGQLADAPEAQAVLRDSETVDGETVPRHRSAFDTSTRRFVLLPDSPARGRFYSPATLWADGRLIQFGGLDSRKGWEETSLSNQAWAWTAAPGE